MISFKSLVRLSEFTLMYCNKTYAEQKTIFAPVFRMMILVPAVIKIKHYQTQTILCYYRQQQRGREGSVFGCSRRPYCNKALISKDRRTKLPGPGNHCLCPLLYTSLVNNLISFWMFYAILNTPVLPSSTKWNRKTSILLYTNDKILLPLTRSGLNRYCSWPTS